MLCRKKMKVAVKVIGLTATPIIPHIPLTSSQYGHYTTDAPSLKLQLAIVFYRQNFALGSVVSLLPPLSSPKQLTVNTDATF